MSSHVPIGWYLLLCPVTCRPNGTFSYGQSRGDRMVPSPTSSHEPIGWYLLLCPVTCRSSDIFSSVQSRADRVVPSSTSSHVPIGWYFSCVQSHADRAVPSPMSSHRSGGTFSYVQSPIGWYLLLCPVTDWVVPSPRLMYFGITARKTFN
ncbi:hypothetical protein Bpfe_016807 [Biomphalaria pfeifferi]|uniref:Uncharacterized protein n=1 Tax=Biomphalaria pfeifferi TaxID=112525 RepID=A0AAD8BH06_BIOPF|nr:hypothetical protein Bpfe_016807 [Biomphalaria pfeifferi]